MTASLPHRRTSGGSIIGHLAFEARVRRDIRRLETLDNHLLRDMGLARDELRRAVRNGRD